MKLNEIKGNPEAKRKRLRVGRGEGSGKGKTGGRGQKGQKSRSGVSLVGFEGGQMPLYRRVPKRGFTNPFTKKYEIVNLGKLEAAILEKKIDPKKIIDGEVLKSAGMIKGKTDGVRLLGKGELTKSVRIEVSGVSKSAKESVEKLGGEVLILETKKALNDRKLEEKRKADTSEVSDEAKLN